MTDDDDAWLAFGAGLLLRKWATENDRHTGHVEEVCRDHHRHDGRDGITVAPVELLFDGEPGDVLEDIAGAKVLPALVARVTAVAYAELHQLVGATNIGRREHELASEAEHR